MLLSMTFCSTYIGQLLDL